jgi:hypothetical protein
VVVFIVVSAGTATALLKAKKKIIKTKKYFNNSKLFFIISCLNFTLSWQKYDKITF